MGREYWALYGRESSRSNDRVYELIRSQLELAD